jgi:hypothetical protein
MYDFLTESRMRLSTLYEIISGTSNVVSCATETTGSRRKTGRRYLKNTFIATANLTFYLLGFH